MKIALRLAIIACTSVAALTLSGTALAAFTTPKLTVSIPGSGGLLVRAETGRDDDAPFRLVIYVPREYTGSFTQPPATQVGAVEAQIQRGPGSDVLIPLSGVIQAVDPAPFRASPQALGCVGAGSSIDAVYMLVLNSPIPPPFMVPLFVTAISAGPEAAFASAKMTVCLPSPYVPEAQGGARESAKVLNATLNFRSVFTSPSASGELRWRSVWTPWTAGPALPPLPNAAGTVEAQAVVRPAGRLTLRAGTYNARSKRLSVRGSLGAAGPVQLFLNNRRVATVRAGANGSFTTSVRIVRKGTYSLRARATVAASETSGCTGSLPGVTCLRSTASGFAATSPTVRVRIR